MTEALFLTSADVADLAEPAEYVTAVRDAYRQRGEGAPAEPRTTLTNADPPGMLTSYAAVLPETGAMGGYMYRRPRRLPRGLTPGWVHTAGFGESDA